MARRRPRSGFSLVEALFAAAVLVAALVPALLAFHAHIAAATRLRQSLDVALALENLHSETERQLLGGTDAPQGAVTLAGPVRTVVGQPVSTPCGDTRLLRYALTAEDPATAIRREGLLYLLPPAQENRVP